MTDVICRQCGATFYAKPSHAASKRFCSMACRRAADGRVTKTCEICGTEFSRKRGEADSRFCSASCRGVWSARTFLDGHRPIRKGIRPPYTWTSETAPSRKGKRPTNAFTSEHVRGENNPKWKPPLEFVCAACGKVFYRKPWQVRRHVYGDKRFCSLPCFRQSGVFREEKSPCWTGGITTYRGKGWLKQRALAVARDGGACQACGKFLGNSIPVHHITPFYEFTTAAEANRLENLICLCPPCHMKAEPRKSGKRPSP